MKDEDEGGVDLALSMGRLGHDPEEGTMSSSSSNALPPMYQHHQLLIPHRGGELLVVAGTGAASSAPAPVESARSNNASIYLQEDDDDDDDDPEDEATASFSYTSGGSHQSHPSSSSRNSLPTTPEGNEEDEEDCESALIELEEIDDEESARQPIYYSNVMPSSSAPKVLPSADITKKKKCNKAKTTRKTGMLVNRRAQARGYLHLSEEQNGYVDAVLAQEEALRHVRIVDTCVVAVGILCLVPLLQAALVTPAAGSNSTWQFYQSVGTPCAVTAVSQVSLAMLYDTHSALLAYVGRMTLTVKFLNWIWIMFVVALPLGSFLVVAGRTHFGYVVNILVARFVTALMLWKVRSQPKTWKHDVAPRFPVMLRAFVDCTLLVGAVFLSLTTPGYLSALLVVAGPVITRCLLVAFPGLSFD